MVTEEAAGCSAADTSPSESVPEKSPYSSEFLVQFCKEHWASWIAQVQRTLTRVQQDHLETPTVHLENTMYGLEQLLHPLLKVDLFNCRPSNSDS